MTTAPARPGWLPQSLFPYESRFQEVDGCRVHYVDEGQGPPLLMLHGNPTFSFLYRKVIAGLRDRFRCIALDYPGFGLSTARAGYDFRPATHSRIVEGFVDALGLDGLTVMVQDWGGPIGLGLAGRRSERVRALVIGNTWAWPADAPTTVRFAKVMGSLVGQLAITRLNFFVNVLIPGGVKRGKLPQEVMTAYRGPFLRPEDRAPVAIFPKEILASHEYLGAVERGLAALRDRPCLIVWGDADIAFREAERRRFEATFPRHRTHVLHGAGHYIQEDGGEEIALAVRAWWADDVAPVK
ncbi:MAG TPA: alpha/beta fold hydrolase [Polyangia bacterium]|jgi:haloalkane dehalogenase